MGGRHIVVVEIDVLRLREGRIRRAAGVHQLGQLVLRQSAQLLADRGGVLLRGLGLDGFLHLGEERRIVHLGDIVGDGLGVHAHLLGILLRHRSLDVGPGQALHLLRRRSVEELLAGLGGGIQVHGGFFFLGAGFQVRQEVRLLFLRRGLCLLTGGKGQAREHVHRRVVQLGLYNGLFLQFLQHVVAEEAGVAHSPGEHGGRGVRIGADDAHDLQRDAQIIVVVEVVQAGLSLPEIGVAAADQVRLKAGRGEQQLVGLAAEFFIGPGAGTLRLDGLLVEGGSGDFGHLGLVLEAQGVEHQVGQLIVLVDHQHHLVIGCGPLAVDEIILLQEKIADYLAVLAGQQLLPDLHGAEPGHVAHIGRGEARSAGAVQRLHGRFDQVHHVGVDNGPGGVLGVDVQIEVVAVLQSAHVGEDGAVRLLQVGLEALEVVGLGAGAGHGVHHVVHDGVGVDAALLLLGLFVPDGHHGGHHGGHVHSLSLDVDGVGGERVLLDLVDVGLDAGGEGEDQGDADDADGAGQGRQHGAALFGQQIVQREPQRGGEGHGGKAPLPLVLHRRCRRRHVGVGVGDDFAVQQAHGAGGVLLRQLGVVCHHDDQPILGDFFQ